MRGKRLPYQHIVVVVDAVVGAAVAGAVVAVRRELAESAVLVI